MTTDTIGADTDPPLGTVSETTRAAVHSAIDRWLAACELHGNEAWATGCAGYIGKLQLMAVVDDDGVTLRCEHSFNVELP
jgi:hypothetical protein